MLRHAICHRPPHQIACTWPAASIPAAAIPVKGYYWTAFRPAMTPSHVRTVFCRRQRSPISIDFEPMMHEDFRHKVCLDPSPRYVGHRTPYPHRDRWPSPGRGWDACARATGSASQGIHEETIPRIINTRTSREPIYFSSFFDRSELSNAVGGRSGWQPRHLLAETTDGELLGAVPCMSRPIRGANSLRPGLGRGLRTRGRRYYPKLQVAVPFTPVTGPACSRAPARWPRPCAAASRGAAE